MSALREEKATLQEQLGRALNSSGLAFNGRSPNAETPLQQIAGLGAAALHIHHGADRKGVPVTSLVSNPKHQVDPQDAIAAELASLLWHVKYADQHGLVARTAIVFASWLTYRGRFHFVPEAERPGLLHALATRSLHEWLSGRCIACGGSGLQERSASGPWISPRGAMQRNAVFRTCAICAGTKRQMISHTQRIMALGITRARYDSERWDSHCAAALAWLNKAIARLNRPLTVQLERSKKRV